MTQTSQDLLSELHGRYLLLSGRFKAAWTFHQFLKGVTKVFPDQPLQIDSVSFQSIYSELKTASKNLNVASAEVANQHLDTAEKELAGPLDELIEVDDRLTPSMLRRFFKRVRNYDARILGQLLKFYLFTRGLRWDHHRLDKADFLLTRLGELLLELDRDPIDRRHHALGDSLRGIWQVVDELPPSDQRVSEVITELDRLRESMQDIESLEDFHEMGVIQRFREIKRELGVVFFHPEVAQRIIEINLFLAGRVEGLYQLEELRVAEEFNRVFELERGAPRMEDALDEKLRDFKVQVEDLERSVKGQNVKIGKLVNVRERARELIPRLETLGDDTAHGDTAHGAGSVEVEEGVPGAAADVVPEPPPARREIASEATPEAEEVASPDAEDDEKGDTEGAPDSVAALGSEIGDSAPEREDSAVPELFATDRRLLPASEDQGPLAAPIRVPGGDLDRREAAGSPEAETGAAEEESPPFEEGRLDDGGASAQGAGQWRDGLSAERPLETLRIRTGYAEELGEVLRQLLQMLENTDWELSPKLTTQVPELRDLRLEPREVLAYRRLFFPQRFDRGVEQFLVEAASLRILIAHQAEELVDLIDDSEEARHGALHEQAQAALVLASEFEKRFQHFVLAAVHARDCEEAGALQLSWMRQLREYSGLWLLLNR